MAAREHVIQEEVEPKRLSVIYSKKNLFMLFLLMSCQLHSIKIECCLPDDWKFSISMFKLIHILHRIYFQGTTSRQLFDCIAFIL